MNKIQWKALIKAIGISIGILGSFVIVLGGIGWLLLFQPSYSNFTNDERQLIYDNLEQAEEMPIVCPWCSSPKLKTENYDPNICSELVCLDCGLHVCVTCSHIYG